MYQAKDFIETAEGLVFAVVEAGLEQQTIRCFLRYIAINGHWQKVASDEANRYLSQHYPQYLFYSAQLDARLHGVEHNAVIKQYSPRSGLARLLRQPAEDAVIADLQALCQLFAEYGIDSQELGITGSCLIGMQNHNSDLDLVLYQRDSFQQIRAVVQYLIADNHCQALDDQDWLASYQRRGCDLSLDDYIWHEQRKYNKALFRQRKFDLSLVSVGLEQSSFHKLGTIQLAAKVVDDQFGFDYPARFMLDHPSISSVVSFTATYSGQAQTGEFIQIAGQLEQDHKGEQRIVVGSNREALGEYIKVIHA